MTSNLFGKKRQRNEFLLQTRNKSVNEYQHNNSNNENNKTNQLRQFVQFNWYMSMFNAGIFLLLLLVVLFFFFSSFVYAFLNRMNENEITHRRMIERYNIDLCEFFLFIWHQCTKVNCYDYNDDYIMCIYLYVCVCVGAQKNTNKNSRFYGDVFFFK